MALLDGKQIRNGSIPNSKLATPAGTASTLNKGMTASVTTADGQPATATTLGAKPAGYPLVMVNGMGQELGDGVKTKDCYFSADGGATARAISAIASGDSLRWNGSIAGYELATTDKIDVIFAA